MMDPLLLKRVIEAVLMAAAQPLSLGQLAALFTEEENVDNEQLLAALQALAEDCELRGIELKEVASGYRYQIREDVHTFVTRLWTERQTKYSRALLETLALIAYRQPITRAEIEQIRGVAVSSSIIKTLEEREWVRVVGYRDVPGRPALFGTSRNFLDYFNLKSLDELPPLAEIRDLDEYDPQLDLAPVVPPSLELPPEDVAAIAAEAAALNADNEADGDGSAMPAAAADAPAEAGDSGMATAGDGAADAMDEADATTLAQTSQDTAGGVANHSDEDAAADAPSADNSVQSAEIQAVADTDDDSNEPAEAADAAYGEADEIPDPDPVDDWPAADDSAGHDDDSEFAQSDSLPDDDAVDPADPTTSDDVPEHTA